MPPIRAFLQERLFSWMFDGIVYNQVWEDPIVDLEALALERHHNLICIASAGCNALAYLSGGPARIDAIDRNRHHLAVARLKREALRRLPTYEQFFDLFGRGDLPANTEYYDVYIRSHLDAQTREYWDRHITLTRRRIDVFAMGFYRSGILSKFVGAGHAFAKINGADLSKIVHACGLSEQRRCFDALLAPLFDHWLIKLLVKSPISLFPLGIPSSQYRRLFDASKGDMHSVLRGRLERLACGFPVEDNYFAWQVFARTYDIAERRAIPHYLRPEVFQVIKPRVDDIKFHETSITEYLERQPAASIHRYVLLDIQDWMDSTQITRLWREITRTAVPGDARVIFRSAGDASPTSGLPAEVQADWSYDRQHSRALHAADRASIYGGFHLYLHTVGAVAISRQRKGA